MHSKHPETIALHAGWDDALLRVQLEELKSSGMALDVVGFSEKEFNALVDNLESELRRDDEGVYTGNG